MTLCYTCIFHLVVHFLKVMHVKYSTAHNDEMFTLQYRNMECIRGVSVVRKIIYCLNYEYV